MNKTDFEKLFDKGAQVLADITVDKEAPREQKISAFKALTTYYGLRFKKDPPQAAESVQGFERFRGMISESDDASVRSGEGRN